MVTFDEVLPRLVAACESEPGFDEVGKVVAVRDLVGRVRLAFKMKQEPAQDGLTVQLEAKLAAELGKWFDGPILGPGAKRERANLRSTILELGNAWPGAHWIDPIQGRREPPPGRWYLIESRLSKIAWLTEDPAKPPWPLGAGMPAIVTFFSFKGGVGRTTLHASVAWQLALQKKRVIVVDLDLEAPGIADLLGASARRGVIDAIIDHAATGTCDLTDLLAPAEALGADAAPWVDVVPAGALDASYFEKLSRLDFVGAGVFVEDRSVPAREALRTLLRVLAGRTPRADYILLDSRAGLHDLAGLSLHDLAHVDVLVGRDSDQSYRGLDLTIAALGRRRAVEDMRCIVAQSMAPGDVESEEHRRVTDEFRTRVYEMFDEHVYARLGDEDAPELDDAGAHHYPTVLPFEPKLLHFTKVESLQSVLADGAAWQEAARRVIERCRPDESAQDDDS
jgi:MinD-like ATPase involved in chromosome partitioning or flagellar assembly